MNSSLPPDITFPVSASADTYPRTIEPQVYPEQPAGTLEWVAQQWGRFPIPEDGNNDLSSLVCAVKDAFSEYIRDVKRPNDPFNEFYKHQGELKGILHEADGGLYIQMLHLLSETERILRENNLWSEGQGSLLTEEESQSLLSWHKRQVSTIAASSIQMLDSEDIRPESEEDHAIYTLWQRLNTLRTENSEEGVTVESMREYALETLHVATRLLENLIDTGDGETGLVPLLSRFPDHKYSVEILNNTLNNPLYLRIIHEELPALLDGNFFSNIYSLIREFNFSSGLEARKSWLGKTNTQDLQDIAHIKVLQRRLQSVIKIAIALESMMVSLNKGTVPAGFAQTREA